MTQLNKLIPKEEEEKKEPVVDPENPKKSELTKEDLQEVFSQYSKAEDFIALAPPEMQDQLMSGLTIFREEREKMITEITKHSKFSKDELSKMDNVLLKKMHSSVVPEGDYSASRIGVHQREGLSREAKIMLGLED